MRVESVVPSMLTVAPGTGTSVLSSTTPLTEVAAGSSATIADAVKVTSASGRPVDEPRPRHVVADALLETERQSRGDSAVAVGDQIERALAVLEGAAALDHLEAHDRALEPVEPSSVTTAANGARSGWPAAPTC